MQQLLGTAPAAGPCQLAGYAATKTSTNVGVACAVNGASSRKSLFGEHFNPAALLSRADGDLDLIRKMVHLFARQSDKLLGAIDEAIAQQDGPALERAAHKLKGSVGNFGASQSHETAQHLENCGRAGDFVPAAESSTRLRKQVDSLKRALTEFTREKNVCVS